MESRKSVAENTGKNDLALTFEDRGQRGISSEYGRTGRRGTVSGGQMIAAFLPNREVPSGCTDVGSEGQVSGQAEWGELSDGELVEQCLCGCREAYEEIVKR